MAVSKDFHLKRKKFCAQKGDGCGEENVFSYDGALVADFAAVDSVVEFLLTKKFL